MTDKNYSMDIKQGSNLALANLLNASSFSKKSKLKLLSLTKIYTVGNHMPRLKVFIYFTKKQDNLGQEFHCTLKIKED